MRTALSACLLSLGLLAGTVHAADATATCESQAAAKKLAGAAKNSFIKKCVKDAGAAPMHSDACDKAAAEKKLAGAAKNSFLKKCVADEAAARK
jgi:hypothetical protein